MIQETNIEKKIYFLERLMAKMDAKGCEPNDIIYVENYLTKLDQQLDDQELKKRWDDTQKDYDMHSQMILQVTITVN